MARSPRRACTRAGALARDHGVHEERAAASAVLVARVEHHRLSAGAVSSTACRTSASVGRAMPRSAKWRCELGVANARRAPPGRRRNVTASTTKRSGSSRLEEAVAIARSGTRSRELVRTVARSPIEHVDARRSSRPPPGRRRRRSGSGSRRPSPGMPLRHSRPCQPRATRSRHDVVPRLARAAASARRDCPSARNAASARRDVRTTSPAKPASATTTLLPPPRIRTRRRRALSPRRAPLATASTLSASKEAGAAADAERGERRERDDSRRPHGPTAPSKRASETLPEAADARALLRRRPLHRARNGLGARRRARSLRLRRRDADQDDGLTRDPRSDRAESASAWRARCRARAASLAN